MAECARMTSQPDISGLSKRLAARLPLCLKQRLPVADHRSLIGDAQVFQYDESDHRLAIHVLLSADSEVSVHVIVA